MIMRISCDAKILTNGSAQSRCASFLVAYAMRHQVAIGNRFFTGCGTGFCPTKASTPIAGNSGPSGSNPIRSRTPAAAWRRTFLLCVVFSLNLSAS
jgi:hypothetical protein